jgi:hypothetical protein
MGGRHLALLAGPRLRIVAYHLVPTPAGDALALTLSRQERPSFRVVCLQANRKASERQVLDRYVTGVLSWCAAHPAAVVVLAGGIDVSPEVGARLAERFANVCTSSGSSSALRVSPAGAQVQRAGFVDQGPVAEAGGRAALADVAVP